MTFSQGATNVPDTTFHTIYAPLAAAVGRMPGVVRAGSSQVVLERQGGAALWHWQGSYDSGTVSLAAVSQTQTRLAVTAQGTTALPLADALTVALYGALERQWAPPAGAVAERTHGRRTKFALVTAAVLIPLLAITGMRILVPPKAMDVASAVAQFREQSQPSEVAVADAGDAQAAAKTTARPARKDRRSAKPAEVRRATVTRQTAAPAQPRQRGAQRQRSASSQPRPDRQQVPAAAAPERRREASADREQPARRQSPTRTQQPAATSPEEGVYRYATDGYESIDRPSSRHDYPSETALSIRATDCGFDARWQPLENRWDEMSVCRSTGEALLPTLSTHREFYGQQNDSNYECGPTNYAYRPQPGATWTGTCADGDAKMQIRGRTIAREPVRVGNETVETVHYALEARISGGDAEGTWTAQRWVDPDTGLLIRVEAQTQATSQSSVGTVQYREELSLMLLSTTPQR